MLNREKPFINFDLGQTKTVDYFSQAESRQQNPMKVVDELKTKNALNS
jgi:hypothetical protein